MDENNRNDLSVLEELEDHGIAIEIVSLALRPANLSDSIEVPSSLRHLKHLKSLEIENARSFPAAIEELRSLEQLVLSNCQFSSLPSEIGCLPNLRYLDISNCMEIRSLPSFYCLEHLKLYKFGCNTLGNLGANLKLLALVNLPHLRSLPSHIDQLTSLEHLELRNLSILSLPNEFGNLSSLKILKAISLDWPSLPNSVTRLQKLEHLQLDNLYLPSLPDSIGDLTTLQCLEMDGAGPGIKLPPSLGELMTLERLVIYSEDFQINSPYYPWAGNGITTLPDDLRLFGLKYLSLRGLMIESLPRSIGELRNLEYLRLDHCRAFQAFPEEIRNLRNLKEVYLPKLADPISFLPMFKGSCNGLMIFDVDDRDYDDVLMSHILPLKNDQVDFLLGQLNEFPKLGSLGVSTEDNLMVANLPSLAISCAKAPALRAITAPAPGFISMHEIMVPSGILDRYRALPTSGDAFCPELIFCPT